MPTLEEQFLAEERARLEREREQQRAARAAASIAQPANPQRTAQVNKLAREVGQPPALVDDNFDEMAAYRRAREARHLARHNPALGGWISDERNAALAQDDLGILERIGDTVAGWLANSGASRELLDNARDGVFAADASQEDGFFDRMGSLIERGGASVDEGLYNFIAGTTGSRRAQEYASTLSQGTTGAQVAGQTDWEAVKNNPSLTTIGSYIIDAGAESVAPMTAIAVPYAGLVIIGVSQTGNIAADRVEKNGGGDVGFGDVARAAPFGFGAAALERIGFKGIFSAPGKRVSTRIGQAAAKEAGTEFAQSTLEYTGGSLGTDKGFNLATAFDQGVAGAVAGFGLGGGIRSTVEVARASRAIEAVDRLMQSSAESQVRLNDPQSFRNLIETLTGQASDGNIYVSGEVIAAFNQDYSNDDFWGQFAEEIDDARLTGGDVAIPLSQAAAELSGKPDWDAIKGDVRAVSGGMTANEIEAAEAEWETIRREAGETLDRQDREARAAAAPGERLRASIRETLMSRGMDPDQAAANAEVSAALFETEAANLGYDLTGREFEKAVSVQRVLPGMVADPERADTLDVVVNAMRGAGDAEIGVGPTLMEFIRDRGGINDPGGDLASMGVPSRLIREFNPDQGSLAGVSGAGDYGIGSTMRAAIEAGFFGDLAAASNSELDTQRMLDAIGAELSGSPVYSETRLDTMRQAGEELRELLASAGLEPDTASMEDIRAAVERFDGGRALEQSLPETIEIDGVERSTLNSEGQPLAATEEGVRAFWAWFGDSKVVDADGRPLVVYHGTAADFEAFDDKKTGSNDRGLWGRGHYFSASPVGPNSYALRQGDGAKLIPAYISLKKPLILKTGSDLVTRLPDGANSRDLVGDNLDGTKIKDIALADGGDGVIQIKPDGSIGDAVAFSPTQIKSVNNRGTFSPDDARILYQRGWHGSTVNFDQFAREKIGQSGVSKFGHGFYFADREDIAREYRTDTGAMFEVEIPEDRDLLKWDDAIGEQPFTVAEIVEAMDESGEVDALIEKFEEHEDAPFSADAVDLIRRYIEFGEDRARDDLTDWGDSQLMDDLDALRSKFEIAFEDSTGGDVYDLVAGTLGSQEAASALFHRLGVKGVKAEDKTLKAGGANIVVFDESDIEIVDKQTGARSSYEQNRGQGPQGQIQFTEGQALIRLFESANASTFQHEMAHFWLERMFANARQSIDTDGNEAARQTFADVEQIKAWFKDNGHPVEGDTIPTEAHEMFARAWEQYLMEGKAPTTRLQNAFRKFSRWLKRIYRTVANLNTPITPEIREVMDRMLATESEIEQAAEARAAYLEFDNAIEAGMSEADARRYAELSEQVRSEAEEQLTGKVMRSIKARGQKQWREQEKVVRAEVEEMVDNRPPFTALKLLRSKDGPRLDKAWLQENFGEDVTGILPAGAPVWKQGGANPDSIAELTGHSSGDELVRDLIGIEARRRELKEGGDKRPVREAIIAQEVKAEMNRRFGDPLADGTIEREASAAVQNDRLGEKVELELKALGSKTKRKPTPYRMAREWARGRIENGVIADMISGAAQYRYTRTAAKAARDAQSAILAGDMDAAFKHKQTEMLHNALAREAAEASQEVDVAVRRLGKFAKQTKAKTLPLDYLDRIHALLEGVEFKKVSQRGLDRRQALRDWIASEEAEGRTVELPERVLNEIDNKNWSRLTVDELLLLNRAVMQIAKLGRTKTKLLTAQKDREVEAAATDMANAIEGSKKGPKPVRTRETFAYRAASAFKGFKAMHRKMASLAREMDSVKDGGPVWDNLIRPMMERFDMEAEMNREATEKLLDILSPFYGRDALGRPKMGGKGIYFESIGQSFNLEERMAIVGQMGNAGNLQRLIDGERGEFGFRWSMEQLNEIKDSLTQEQMDAVQAIWDMFESYRPLIAEKERRVSGVEPEWVEPTPVETQFGTYKGGYWPIKYDKARTLDAAQQADAAEAERQMRGAFTAATTHRSFTKARADKVVNRPLLYSFSGVTQGLTDVVHDLAFHEYLIDANRLLRHPKVSSAMLNYYGPEVMEQFRKGIEDVAAGDTPAQDAWERGINHIRMGATVAGLGWNLKTALLQPFGLTQSIVRVGAPWIARGASQFFAHPIETSREVSEKSRFMRERSNTMQREINEIRNRIRGGTQTGEFLNASFFYMITRTQLAIDIPTWQGAYEKAIAEGNEEARAVSLADQAVRDAQGGGQVGDLSAIQRGGPVRKLFTNFYSFFNTTFNLTAESWARTDFKKPGDVMALALDYLLLYSLPAAMGYFLDKAFAGDDDDDDRSLVEGLASEHLSYLTGTMVGVRELDAPIQNLVGAATGSDLTEYDFGYTGPAGLRFMAESTRAAQQATQGEFDDAMRKSLFNTAGTLFHLPSGQVNKTYEGGRALVEGETDNPLALVSGN